MDVVEFENCYQQKYESDKEKNKSKVICDELQEVISAFHIIISLVKLFACVLNHL